MIVMSGLASRRRLRGQSWPDRRCKRRLGIAQPSLFCPHRRARQHHLRLGSSARRSAGSDPACPAARGRARRHSIHARQIGRREAFTKPGSRPRHHDDALLPPVLKSSSPWNLGGSWSESELFYTKTTSDFRLYRLTPQIDCGWVRGKNSKLLIHKPSPRFVVGRRNRCQEGDSGGDRCPKCADETIPGDFELPELVQQDEITPRGDIALHRGRSGNGADSIKVTHSHAGT
jgi:hypothetical protein